MAVSPSQLRMIPESKLKAQLLKALDIKPKPEWVSRRFDFMDPNDHDHSLEINSEGEVIYHRGFTSSLIHINQVPKAVNWPAGTPTGDALRVWLRHWGWLPKPERDALAAQADTRTII